MAFDPNKPFSLEDEGGTAVATVPSGGFDPSKPFTVEDAPDPAGQGRESQAAQKPYLERLNAGEIPLDTSGTRDAAEQHYQNAKAYFDGDAIAQTVVGGGKGVANFISNPGKTLVPMAKAVRDWDARATAEFDREAKDHPWTSIPRLVGSAGAGLLTGGLGLVRQGVNLTEDTGKYIRQKFSGDIDPGRDRAHSDYKQRVEAAKLAAATDELKGAVSSPAAFELGEQAAPFVTPLPSLAIAGPAARAGRVIGNLTEDGLKLSAKAAPAVAAGSAVIHGLSSGNMIEAGAGLLAGTRHGSQAIRSALEFAAPSVGRGVGQIVTGGINAGTSLLTPVAFSLAGAPAGDAERASEQGSALGALFSPLSIYHGAGVRQSAEQSALAKQAAVRGMSEYGNNPELDASTARGIATLTPEQQRMVFEQRGLLRDIKNPEGKQIQVHVPDNYAERAVADNGGALADAANSRGYYLDGKGGVFINPEFADTATALKEALGHETGHSIYQDALPTVNARASARLTAAVTDAALDANLQPTPAFQSLINRYASAASGGKTTALDWNSLPVSGEGITRNYLLNELGAETVRAASPDNVGKQIAGREAGDVISDFAKDTAIRLGLKSAPSATAIFGKGPASPIDLSSLQAARKGTYAIGAQARDSFGLPVRIAEADKVAAASSNPTGQQKAGSPGQAQTGTETTSSAQPDTSFRNTPAYQDAFALAVLDRKAGGQGLKPTEAQALLDQAALDPNVADTNSGYLGYIYKARNPAPVIEPAPVGVGASVRPMDISSTRPVVLPAAEPSTQPAPVILPAGEPVTGAAQGPVTLPLNEPAPVNRFTDTRPEPATDPRDVAEVSNPPQSSPPESTPPGSVIPENGAVQAEVPTREAGQTPPAQDRGQAAVQENPSQRSTAVSETNPAPLSKDAMAKIETDVKANFKPAPYNPRGTPQERAQKIADKNAADLADAKAKAIADAHAAALPEGDTRVQMKIDENGKRRISGTHFVDDDPFHQRLIHGDTEAKTRENLPAVQDAIQNGDLLNFDYDSAAETRTHQTAQQRRESQAVSSASSRATGVGNAQLQNKSLRPLSVMPNADGSVGVYGFSPEKLLGNAEAGFKALRDADLADRLPYRDPNDPIFTADVQGAIENHANGYSVQGKRLTPVEGVHVPEPTPGYEPHVLPPARANFINLIMGQDQTLSPKTVTKSTGVETASGKLRRFAAANDNPPSETGEVNPLRDELNRKGLLKSGPDEGSKDLLHSVFETNRADLMSNFRDPTLPVDFTAQRGASFRGDRNQLVPGGKVPRSDYAAAGFLPAREAGASTPAEAAFDVSGLGEHPAAKSMAGAMAAVQSAGYRLPAATTALDVPGFKERNGDKWMSVPATTEHGDGKSKIIANAAYYRTRDLPQIAAKSGASGARSSAHPDHALIHEIGHALHADNVGGEDGIAHYADQQFTEPQKALVAKAVSRRASLNKAEFVAEVFAGQVAGKTYSPAVQELYKSAEGPLPVLGDDPKLRQ